jgi:hypothetical protein
MTPPRVRTTGAILFVSIRQTTLRAYGWNVIERPAVGSHPTGVHFAARSACLMVLSASAIVLGACTDAEALDDQAFRTDSASVSIIHYSSLPPLEASRIALSPEPDLIIGREGGEPEYEFFRIAGVTRLADGSIVVANAGTAQLRFFDSDGRFLKSIGRRGTGPGEFRNMRGLWVIRGDSLVVWDGGPGLGLFSPGGEYVRTARTADAPFDGFGRQYPPTGVLREGRVVGSLMSTSMPTGQTLRSPQLLASMALGGEQWDSTTDGGSRGLVSRPSCRKFGQSSSTVRTGSGSNGSKNRDLAQVAGKSSSVMEPGSDVSRSLRGSRVERPLEAHPGSPSLRDS